MSEHPDVVEARRLLKAVQEERTFESQVNIARWTINDGGLSRILAHIDGLEKECDALKHDMERFSDIGNELAGEIQSLRNDLTAADSALSTKVTKAERIRAALSNLNTALDEMWNDPLRDRLIAARAHNRRIHAAQQASRAALALPTTDGTRPAYPQDGGLGPQVRGIEDVPSLSKVVTDHFATADADKFPDPEGKGRHLISGSDEG